MLFLIFANSICGKIQPAVSAPSIQNSVQSEETFLLLKKVCCIRSGLEMKIMQNYFFIFELRQNWHMRDIWIKNRMTSSNIFKDSIHNHYTCFYCIIILWLEHQHTPVKCVKIKFVNNSNP